MSNRFPLANDLDGNPIALPPEAIVWRVRRRSGKQGRPQCVYDLETGAQLELQLEATVEELRDYGPGVYRLDAIDKDGKIVPGVVAQTEVALTQPTAPEPDEPYGTRMEAAALIRHLVDANVRTMQAMASAFGQVNPVAAPMTITQEAPAPVEQSMPPNWQQLLPLIPNIVQQFVAAYQQMANMAKPVAEAVS